MVYPRARSDATGLPTNITVSRGRIISERPSLNARARIKGLSPISIGRIGIDSTNAWNMARQFSFERGRRLGSVNYSLQQQGRDASPVWSVWCYDRSGRYIGFLSILASTGRRDFHSLAARRLSCRIHRATFDSYNNMLLLYARVSVAHKSDILPGRQVDRFAQFVEIANEVVKSVGIKNSRL